MFPLNDQHAAAREEAEERKWLFALLVTKLWTTSFWFGAKLKMIDEAAWDLVVVLLAGIQVVQWLIRFYRWLDGVWDWFFLSREKKDMKQLLAQRVELDLALKNARQQRGRTKNEADRDDIDLEIQALESRLGRVKDRIEALEAKDKEAERQKRGEQARLEYDQKQASLAKERTEEAKHRHRSRTPTKY